MDKTDTKFAPEVPEVPDDSVELSVLDNNEPQVCEKFPETTPHRLTLKHAVVLFSLTLLWLSAAGPVFFITASIAFVEKDIGGQSSLAWLGMANTLSIAATAPFSGAVSDLIGRRWVALTGLLFVMFGMLLVGLAKRMEVAIGGCAVVGVGAALAELIASAGVMEIVPVNKRGKYVGVLFLLYIPVMGCAAFAQLYSQYSWRWGAWISIILCAVNFILIFAFYYPPPRPNSLGLSKIEILKRIDFLGGFLSLSGFALFLMGIQWAGYTYSWKSVPVITTLILGGTLIILFILWERRAPYPVFPRSLFTEKLTTTMTLIVTACGGANYWSMAAFLPLECQVLFGPNPYKVALLVIPFGVATLLGIMIVNVCISIFAGRNRELLTISSCIMTAGVAGLAAVRPGAIGLVVGLSALGALGVGGIIQPAVTMLTIISPDETIATISAASISARLAGATIGYAVYFNVFQTKLAQLGGAITAAAVSAGLPMNDTISTFVPAVLSNNLTALSEFPSFIVNAGVTAQVDTYLEGFRMIYLVSIVFGVGAIVASLFLRDIKPYMVDRVAVDLG